MAKSKGRKAGGEVLPSGKVRYRLYIGTDQDGKRIYKSFTGPTAKKAREAAQEWAQEHKVLDPSNPTFSEAAAAFLQNRKNTLSPSTYADYARRVRYLEREFPTFCRSHISVISSERVQALINALATRKASNRAVEQLGRSLTKTISPKSVANYYGLIEVILRTRGVELRNVSLPQQKKTPLVIPENDMIRALLDEIRGTELEVPVLLAAFGPMRRGEICALDYDQDIDFSCGVVHVCRSMVLDEDGEWVIKPPKTEAGDRYIDYPDFVIDKVREKGYIVKCTPNTLTRNFFRALDRHGLPHFRFHDLRHFSASFQIALGIPPEYVMERGGWQTAGTMRRYIHIMDKQRRETSQRINAAFEDLL